LLNLIDHQQASLFESNLVRLSLKDDGLAFWKRRKDDAKKRNISNDKYKCENKSWWKDFCEAVTESSFAAEPCFRMKTQFYTEDLSSVETMFLVDNTLLPR
jgi:hypothetical protein